MESDRFAHSSKSSPKVSVLQSKTYNLIPETLFNLSNLIQLNPIFISHPVNLYILLLQKLAYNGYSG